MPGKVPNKNSGVQDSLLYYESQERRRHNCCCVCCLITLLTVLVIAIVIFLLVFVGFPLYFKTSIDIQRIIVFPTENLLPENSEYGNFEKYNISGARLLYIPVDKEKHIVIGVWHLLPEAEVNQSLIDKFDYGHSLDHSGYPVLVHFHDNGGNRIKYVDMYKILRQFFHVIAFDYRGYGDSSLAAPSESDIVNDSVHLYKWIRSQTESDIYLWGHGLGAALCTHTAASLHEEHTVPTGMFLEAPFSTIKDQLKECSLLGTIFSWMPWFELTMLNPLERNGFYLRTVDNVIKVDCPIMIIHAKDDYTTPFSLGLRVLKSAQQRDSISQGNVTFHQLSHKFGYGHDFIYKWKDLPQAIQNHTQICEEFQQQMGY
ncbi:hypothetical protein FQA39_LY12639 [Lamprigera yunnana]|nr:hypothetical protein FQA39_LY12639 [Lamprigera yunnana]